MVPITIVAIFFLLFVAFDSLKFAVLILFDSVCRRRGDLMALSGRTELLVGRPLAFFHFGVSDPEEVIT